MRTGGAIAVWASEELLKELSIEYSWDIEFSNALAVKPKDWKALVDYYDKTKGLKAPEGKEYPVLARV